MKVLSVKQPWAYLLCSGIKDIENRTWKLPKEYIGQRVLIQWRVKRSRSKIHVVEERRIEKENTILS